MDELEKIQRQIAELQQKAEQIQKQKKAEVLEEVRAKIKAYGLTARECGFSIDEKPAVKGQRKPVAIKYRSGEHTWTGRGRKPKWVEAYLANGGKLEDLSV